MKSASFRWRLMLPILGLASLVAAMLVGLGHLRARGHLRRALENALDLKWEEVHEVLAAGSTRVDLERFLELETTYSASPHEFFYFLADEQGTTLLRSQNLGAGVLACAPAPECQVRPHPLEPAREVLVRCRRLPPAVEYAGAQAPLVCVAVGLEPEARALRADLAQNLLTALLGLAFLGTALWVVIGRSLRTVSAITRQAASIRDGGLHQRLPLSGSGDEFDHLAHVLNELFAGLERSLQQMEAFTSDAAHQMRTPLTRIRGELDLVLAGAQELNGDTRARLEDTRSELERLAQTCARLLLLARLDRGALESELRAETLDLAELARELVEQVAPLGTEKGVRVLLRAAAPVRLRGCRALLAEALLNLLDNAIRFTPPGGVVLVSLRVRASEVLLQVRDSGPGVPAAEREFVFRRFFRGAGGSAATGTGLGLAIVRGIARAHGGEARLRSHAGRGAVFQLRLPAA